MGNSILFRTGFINNPQHAILRTHSLRITFSSETTSQREIEMVSVIWAQIMGLPLLNHCEQQTFSPLEQGELFKDAMM